MKPRGVLKYLQILDGVNGLNGGESVCIIADEIEAKRHPLLLQLNGFGKNVREIGIKSPSNVGNIEGSGRLESVGQLNVNIISKISEFG